MCTCVCQENELQEQKRLRQESEKRAAKLEHDLAKTEQRAGLEWMALQQKEMVEGAERKTQALLREAAELATKVGALTKENKIVQRKLQKETKSKQAYRELLDQEISTGRPKRACTQQQPEPEPVRITVSCANFILLQNSVVLIYPLCNSVQVCINVLTTLLLPFANKQAADARGHYDWVHDKVREKESQVAGMGLFSKVDIAANQIVFDALLPDEECSAAFADTEYSCYKHILHKDGASALAIDPGSNMGGNVWACQNDNKVRFLRLLNHSKSPNVFLDIKEAATPFWYERVGGVIYGPWYTCSIRTIREVRVGDEILIKYAEHPEEWDV